MPLLLNAVPFPFPFVRSVVPIVVAIVVLIVGGTGCPALVGDPVKGTISGHATKGPIKAGAVSVFAIDDDGKVQGDPVGRGLTDETGAFDVDVGGLNGPALVCVDGGTYVEEATGGLVELADNALCALVDDHIVGTATKDVLVTPFSTWHATLARCFRSAGRDASLGTASAHAALRLNDFLAAGVPSFDLKTSTPFDVTAGAAPSLTPDVWAGVLLAGLSESAKAHALASGLDPGVRVTAATLTAALNADLDDGACVFDGQGKSGVLSQGNVALSSDTLRGAPQGLGAGILRFLENPERNLSGVTADDVKDLVVRLNEHQSEIFGSQTAVGDVDAPVVTFARPTDGETVAGAIDVNVAAEDASRLTELVFLSPARIADTERICDEDTRCSLQARLNTSLEPAGDVVIAVRATDEAGNTTTKSVTVTINDDAPNLAVTSPTDGASVTGDVQIVASASDSTGIESLVLSGVDPAHLSVVSLRTDELIATWHTALEPEGPVTLTFTATDVGGQPVSQSLTVEVDNLDDGIISGAIDVGTPVTGGTVEAFALVPAVGGVSRGARIGTASVDPETGRFTLSNPFYSGPLLLVHTGGSYTDPATGAVHSLRNGQELSAALENVQPGEVSATNINAWTTLATARALVTAGGDVTDLEAAIAENTERIGLHLRRDGPERNPLPIRATTSADLSSTVIESTNDRAVLALAHAGLSRTAVELTDAAGLDPGAITLVDVVEDLSRDVSNGLYDGVDDGGATVFFDPAASLPATPLTLRTDLASAVSSFLTDAPLTDGTTFSRNASGITTELLFGPGNFYEDIAENNDFRLFSTPGTPFDILPPEVRIAFEAEPDAPVGSARLEADVRLFADADDVGSGLNRFDVVFPPGLTDTSPLTREIRVSVPASFGPNMASLDGACADAKDADAALAALDPATQFCLCVEAADGTENRTARVFCFTRPPPEVQFFAPAENQAFNATDTTVPVSARIIGHWGLTTCRLDAAPALGLTTSANADNECVFDTSANRSAFTDGQHTINVTASDLAGNSAAQSRSFSVETTAPTVTVTSPRPNDALATTSYTLSGTVSDSSIARVELTLTRTFGNPATTEPVFAGTQLATLSGSGTSRLWTMAVTDVGASKSGRRDLTVRAFDTQGNDSAPLTISFVVDNVAPALPALAPTNFAFEGAASPVERSGLVSCGVGQFCVDNRVPVPAANRPSGVVFFPSAAAVTATIERWSTRLADTNSAPQVVASGADNGGAGIKELRFAIRQTCATSVAQLTQVLPTTNTQTVRVTSAAGFDLLNTHQTDAATPLCLSVAAVDRADNTSALAHVFFRWRTIAPPLNVAALSSVGLGDALDASSFSGDGASFTNWLRGNAGVYRAMHAYVTNPFAEDVVVAPGDPLVFGLSLQTTTERRFGSGRLTVWAGDAAKTLRNAQATDAETNTSTTVLPRWSLAAVGAGAGPRIWSLLPTCGAGSCAATAVGDANPPCGLSSSCNDSDPTFNDPVVRTQTKAREMIATTPTVTCHFITNAGQPIATSPCTSDGAPFFVVPAGRTVLFSWLVSHSRGQREFVAPGWTSAQVNATVPFFFDDDPGSGARSSLQVQTVTPANDVVLWLKDNAGAALPRNLLWTERPSFLRCGLSTDANVVECHSGRELTRIDAASLQADQAVFRLKTRHGTAVGNRADTAFNGSGTTTPIPASATRLLQP